MRPPADFTPAHWQALLDDLDGRIVAAAQAYMRSRYVWETDIASGYSELAKLRRGDEPDYDAPGLSIAYAFVYLPRRVACMLGALTLIAERGVPRRVLDIGSGSDAALLALDLWAPGSEIEVISVEPSREMRGFAAELRYSPGIKREWLPIGFANIVEGYRTLQVQDFDLIIMSACLPYGNEQWNTMARQIGGLTRPPSAMLIVEPVAKIRQIVSISEGLEETGWFNIDRRCCHDLPEIVRKAHTLPLTDAMLNGLMPDLERNSKLTIEGRDLLTEPYYPPATWTLSRRYKELIAVCRES